MSRFFVVAIGTRGLHVRRLLGGGLAVLGIAGRGVAQAPTPDPGTAVEPYLRVLGLGASQLRAAAGGQPVVRLVRTDDNRDVAVVGLIAVRAPRDAVVARALEARGVVATRAARFGVLGDPASDADVRGIAFDNSEYKGLRNCRPAECDFKLSATAMRSFIDSVPWSAPNAKAAADDLLRRELLRLVADYRSRGNAALPTYDDGPGVRSADAFAALMAQLAPLLGEHAPELERYLTTYPSERPAAAHDFVYWAEERLPRMRPTLLVNHVVAYAPPGATAFIARKQLYASHYFEGGLELLVVVDAGASGAAGATPTSYLISVRRFRFDYLPGGILNVRGRVRNHLVEATRLDLAHERAAIERTSAASRP